MGALANECGFADDVGVRIAADKSPRRCVLDRHTASFHERPEPHANVAKTSVPAFIDQRLRFRLQDSGVRCDLNSLPGALPLLSL